VYGQPVAQGRPKFTTAGGFARAYDPAKSKDYKSLVYEQALAVRPAELITGAVGVKIDAYFQIPKSKSNKWKLAAREDRIKPTTKPDADNIAKGICDSLNGLIWRDDSQVAGLLVSKYYSDNPRVEVSIMEDGDDE
jgi:Holliday junction resolvase RusA-like endonuclease